MSESDALFSLAARLNSQAARAEDSDVKQPLQALDDAAEAVGRAWSGSWLGYQSCVYYDELAVPPAGARFSQEWGFHQLLGSSYNRGDWTEFRFEDVVSEIERLAGNPDTSHAESKARASADVFDEAKSAVSSILSIAAGARDRDTFLAELLEQVKRLRILADSDLVASLMPSGQTFTRDMAAVQGGRRAPPHVSVVARVYRLRYPFYACAELGKVAQRAASHLKNLEGKATIQDRIGTNVFIGHGRSPIWKDLRDFVRDRVHLPWDEFNRVPVAGVTNIARLSQMLDETAIAFLVMTAEDEQADGKVHARLNVVHEAGLFQGRLGFQKAIILLEQGCEEFSNVQGLGQIRFPEGNIGAAFEDIRRVLEREGLIE